MALWALGVLFIVFKLTATVTWSWWLVLLPFYFFPAAWVAIMLLALFGIGVGAGGIFGVAWMADSYRNLRRSMRNKK